MIRGFESVLFICRNGFVDGLFFFGWSFLFVVGDVIYGELGERLVLIGYGDVGLEGSGIEGLKERD